MKLLDFLNRGKAAGTEEAIFKIIEELKNAEAIVIGAGAGEKLFCINHKCGSSILAFRL